MSIVTFYTLFFDDLRILFLPKSADLYMDTLTLIAMALYLVELALGVLVIDQYFMSFYFWVDLVSLLSMLPDVSFIIEGIEGGLGGISEGAELTKTGRASKVIKIIRGNDDAAAAKEKLIKDFKLNDEQATYILDMPLRRLTKMSKIELESELEDGAGAAMIGGSLALSYLTISSFRQILRFWHQKSSESSLRRDPPTTTTHCSPAKLAAQRLPQTSFSPNIGRYRFSNCVAKLRPFTCHSLIRPTSSTGKMLPPVIVVGVLEFSPGGMA